MIERIVDAAVATQETFGPPPERELFPTERERIERAVQRRRRDFADVRWCARQAMAQLGVPAAAILPGDRGAPQWPAGVVGSMTHCEGYRGAAVALAAHVHGVGIDAEPHGPLPDGVLDVISLPVEREWLAQAPPGVHWDKLLFSAKESTYKVWFPLTGRWLGFEDAHISIDPAAGTFTTRLLVPGPVVDGVPLTELRGRWTTSPELVLTAISLTAWP
ncbi:4'-phosphopantetheinyl transferase superfamily protein [Rhodococcus sp. X156]|uniref:4'-phosphopantetheinyl transferase family protein n=1 Tax=Rhodococcus sp. X156 TaxID=2499145 RepID=UPI0013E3316E|nr:4'-phosphopantetheinyl transferase superfamily protein [Rhodococcus sp. X156]